MKKFYSSILLCLSAGLAPLAKAQDLPIPSRYTFEDLDRFWKNVLNTDTATSLNTYRSILQTLSTTPSDNLGRLEGVWTGNAGQSQAISFFVEPLPASQVAFVAKREMGLHMYLIRAENYQAPDFKNPLEMIQQKSRLREEQISLAQRRKQASYELFVVKILRYREADSLEAKCSYLNEADQFYNLAEAQVISDRVRLADIQGLIDFSSATHKSYESTLLDKKVCQAQRATGRADTLKKTEKILNTKIVNSLQKEYARSIDPIATVLKEKFDPILDIVYEINPRTGELLEFEDLQSASNASIDLVARDAFNLQSLFPELDGIRYADIKSSSGSGFVPAALQSVIEAQKAMIDATRRFLADMNKIQAVVPDAEKPRFAICSGLDKQFDGVLPKGVATKDFAGKVYPPFGDVGALMNTMNSCLSLTQTYLKTLQTRDAKQQMVDEFATRLEALSREMLHLSN